MKKLIRQTAFIVTSILLVFQSFCQHDISVRVGKNELIKLPFLEFVIGEPHLSVNPTDSNHMLLGAMMFDAKQVEGIACISAVSFNGGKTWKCHRFAGKTSADPWCVITSKRTAVFSFLNNDTLWTCYSNDGGTSWNDPVSHGKGHDHETMTFDAQSPIVYLLSVHNIKTGGSPSRDAVYVSRSFNLGKSFDYKTSLVQNNLWKNTLTPVVLSNGSLIVSFSEYAYKSSAKSLVQFTKNHAWTMISKDSGLSFSEPRFVTDQGGGFSVLEADRSEKFRDRLYWITRNEGGRQIQFLSSVNNGESWSLPVIVSGSSFSKTIPNVATTKAGIIGVTWYEKDTTLFCQNFYFAASVDGGQTFSSAVKISDQISCADSTKNGTALRGGWSSGGHYTGIVSTGKEEFAVVWADARSGRYQLYFARIHIQNKESK